MKLKEILIELEEAKKGKGTFIKAIALAAGLATATLATSCVNTNKEETCPVEKIIETDALRYVTEANRKYIHMVYDAAEKAGVDPLLMIALVQSESRFNPKATSGNDYGLFQLNSIWHPQHKDSISNHIKYGISFYKQLLSRFKDRDKALRYYNTGNSEPTKTGNRYVTTILNVYNQLK